MRFSMLYSGEQILSFKLYLVLYAGVSLSYRLLKMLQVLRYATKHGYVNIVYAL